MKNMNMISYVLGKNTKQMNMFFQKKKMKGIKKINFVDEFF